MSKKRNILMLSLSGFLSVIALASCTPSDVPSEITTYTITVTSDEYGTITPSKTSAEAGEEITLTVNVNESTKKLDKIYVNDVAITSGEDGTYRFTMPSENVTIKGSYSDVTTPETYTITTESLEGVTITPSKTTGLVAGEEVSITVTVTDTTKEIATLTANDVTLGKGTDGTYKLVMPSENVTLKATLKDVEVEATYTITATSVTGATVTLDKETAKVGEEVSVTVTVTDETKEVATVTANEVTLGKGTDGTYKLTMPAENVTVTVTLKDIVVEVEETYDLTLPANTADYTLTASKTTGILAGETLQITVNLLNSSKMITSLLLNELPLSYKASEVIQTISVIMPSSDSTISITVTDDPSKVAYALTTETPTPNGYSVYFTNAEGEHITEALAGEEVTAVVENTQTESQDYIPSRIRITIGSTITWYDYDEILRERYNSTTYLWDYYYTFTMPADTLEFYVSTQDAYYEINYTDDDIVAYQDATLEAQEGDTVYVYPGGLGSTYVTGLEVMFGDQALDITYNEDRHYYTFRMPKGDVDVTSITKNVEAPVIISTSEHTVLTKASYYDDRTTDLTISDITSGSTGMYLVNAPTGVRLNLTVEVTEEGASEYIIGGIVATDTVTQEVLYDDDDGDISFTTTGNPVSITVSETSKYIDFTPEVYVRGEDGAETLLTEGFDLKVGTIDDSVDPSTIINNKIARGYDRFGYTFETTDETMIANDEFYQVESITINEKVTSVASMYDYDGYPYLWLDTADYDSDTYTVKIVVSKGQYVFEENAEFLGSYVGNGLTEYSEYYSTYIKSSDLTINRDGTYTYGLEVNDWYASYDSISVDSTLAFDGTESYLTDATEGYDIYYKDGWAFVKGATLDKSALLKKGARSASTSTFDTALSTDETKVLLKQSIDSTTYYTYIDLTTNTIYPELTLEGKAFSTGSVAIFKDKEGATILSVAFSASDEFDTITLDEYAGFVISKDATSAEDWGTITLDGAGGATVGTDSYSYEISGNEITFTTRSTAYNLGYKFKVTMNNIDNEAKTATYTATNAPKPVLPEASDYYYGTTTIGEVTYRIRFDLDSDNSFRMYYAIVDAEGVVGEEHGLITRFIKGMADLTNGGVIIIRPNVLSDYDGLTLDSVKLRVDENGQMLLSLTDVVVDGINFTFTDVVLSTETEA